LEHEPYGQIRLPHLLIVDNDPTVVGKIQTGNQLESCALSASAWAHESDDLSVGHVKY
jgi:hypothetical protein